jgi:hypothetical protein
MFKLQNCQEKKKRKKEIATVAPYPRNLQMTTA